MEEAEQVKNEIALAVESVVEGNAETGIVFDGSPGLEFLCQSIESVLTHGYIGKPSFFGGSKKHYWFMLERVGKKDSLLSPLIAAAARESTVSSAAGRGRTWIRAALVAGPLSAHLSALYVDHRLDMWDWYAPHALAVKEDLVAAVIAALDGLDALQFDLLPKNVRLDTSWQALVEPPKWRRRAASVAAEPKPIGSRRATLASMPNARGKRGKRGGTVGEGEEKGGEGEEVPDSVEAWAGKYKKLERKMETMQLVHASDYAHLQMRLKEMQRDYDEACLDLATLRQEVDANNANSSSHTKANTSTASIGATSSSPSVSFALDNVHDTSRDGASGGSTGGEAQWVDWEEKAARLEEALATAQSRGKEWEAELEGEREKRAQVETVLAETKATLQTLATDHQTLESRFLHLETVHRRELKEKADAQVLAKQMKEAQARAEAAEAAAETLKASNVELILKIQDAERVAVSAAVSTEKDQRLEQLSQQLSEEQAAFQTRLDELAQAHCQELEHLEARLAEATAQTAAARERADQAEARVAEAEAERDRVAKARSHLEEDAAEMAKELEEERRSAGVAAEAAAARASELEERVAQAEAVAQSAEAARVLEEEKAGLARAAADGMSDSISALHDENTELTARVAHLRHEIEIMKQERLISGKDDKDVSACHGCGDAFGVFRRKHHCRKCGVIFCHTCSAQKVALEAACKPVRVCNRCFAFVQSENPEGVDEPIVDPDSIPTNSRSRAQTSS